MRAGKSNTFNIRARLGRQDTTRRKQGQSPKASKSKISSKSKKLANHKDRPRNFSVDIDIIYDIGDQHFNT